MSFQDYSKSVVKDFLGSVAFIDDRIFTSDALKPRAAETSSTKGDPDIIIPVQKIVNNPSRKPIAITKEELRSIHSEEDIVVKTDDVDIDPKEFMSAFTKEGIHCSLCEYDENDLDSYKALLQKSDVAILDWNMNSGKEEGTEACLLIGDLLAKDQESSLRLIVIYSSTPKVQWSEILGKRIKPLFGERQTSLTDSSIISGHTKIVFVHKGDPTILPTRLINEFVEMTSGLVSNAALKAISLVRKNTNKILGSYHKELDPAYLSNRIHLANNKQSPELTEYLLKDMVMGSIFDLIQSSDIKEACDGTQIDKWLDEIDQFKSNKIKVNGTELEVEKNERIIWLTNGYSDFQKRIIKLSGVTKNPEIKNKGIKDYPTDYFTPTKNTLENSNEEFAILSHQKANYLGIHIKPILSLGCILKYVVPENSDSSKISEHYLLSVQQPCDSLRLKNKEKRSFIFIELKENPDAPDTKIIINESGRYRRFAPKINSHFLKTFIFEETNDGIVQAVNQKFMSVDGTEFEWLCDLKSNHSQRIVNEFSAYLSRVGLDEPEFLRLL